MSLPGAAGRGGSASRSERGEPAADRSFPRSSRLTSRQQFVAVYEKGRRVSSSSFVLFGLPNSTGGCRLGVTATRKLGGAVRRNLAKRRLREIFRRHRVGLQPPLDLVVNARPSIAEVDTPELEREFLTSFARLARRWQR